MILVIDGNNLAHMCLHIGNTNNKTMENRNGLNVQPIDIFMKKLYKLYDILYPDEIIICWDKKLNGDFKNFRKLNESYKANRKSDPIERENFYSQCDIIESLVEQLGIRNVHPNVMEADDVIAWIAHNANDRIVIGSFDQDLLQLVNENVDYYDLRKRKKITLQNFEETMGVSTNRFLLYKMVLGDKSDNIVGLKGFGKVKSKKLVDSDHPFDQLNLNQRKLLHKNRKLMDLTLGYLEYPEEVPVYESQINKKPERDFNKFMMLARLNNIDYILDYKWKWEDLLLNT